MKRVLKTIAAERIRQDRQWGGADHDDEHSTSDFIDFMRGRLDVADGIMTKPKEKRRRLVQVAALAVAAVESMDRKGRR